MAGRVVVVDIVMVVVTEVVAAVVCEVVVCVVFVIAKIFIQKLTWSYVL